MIYGAFILPLEKEEIMASRKVLDDRTLLVEDNCGVIMEVLIGPSMQKIICWPSKYIPAFYGHVE